MSSLKTALRDRGYAVRRLALLAPVAVVAACANQGPPCSYDFRDQKFLSIASSAASGEYQRCTDHLNQQLLDLRVEEERAKRDAERLEKLAQQSSGEVATARRDLASVNRQLNGMIGKLERAQLEQAANQKELNSLIQQQRNLQGELLSLNKVAIKGEDPALTRKIQRLKRRIADLERRRQQQIGA